MRVELVAEVVTRDLRRAVLRPGTSPDSPLPGDGLADALHLAARTDDGTVVGTCLLSPTPYPRRPEVGAGWQLRAMATAPAARGCGVGAAVLTCALAVLRQRSAHLVWCNARASAITFYARHGWLAEGEAFVTRDTGLEHRTMWRPVGEPFPAAASSVRVDRSGGRSESA